MIMFLFYLLFGEEPRQIVQVENRGRYIPDVRFGKAQLTEDGGFLVNNYHHIWHWDSEGKLINLIGGRGEGPGEFIALSEVMWTGSYYWAMDGFRGLSSIFDRDGNYLFRTPTRFRQFIPVEGRLFIVDYSRLNPHLKEYPTTVQEIQYWIDNEQLRITKVDEPFRKVTPRQRQMELNFKKVWIVQDDTRLFLVDELEPKIWVYDHAAIDREQRLEGHQVYEPDFIPLNLSGWVDPPDRMKRNHEGYNAKLQWWNSWSRLNFFGRIGGDYFVAYEIPNPDDPLTGLQTIQRLNQEGKSVGKPIIVSGRIMGERDGLIFLFQEDDEISFRYRILGYEF